MTSTFRTARSALTLVAALMFAVAGPVAIASAEAGSQVHKWQLENRGGPQRMCVKHGPAGSTHWSYFIFAVTGDWSTDLDYGMRDLPPGWTATEFHLPPGSNYPDPDDGGVTINGWIEVEGPASAPLGVYDADIWVSDGTVTQTAPTEIVITTASWLECMQARG